MARHQGGSAHLIGNMVTLTSTPATLSDADQTVANSRQEIEKRLALGQIGWIGPLQVVMARPLLFVLCQAMLAAVFTRLHRPSPWRSAGAWWTVYGTLVDIGCLLLIAHFTRIERIGIRDLIGARRLRWGSDILVGLGLFLVIFPFFLAGSYPASLLVYGSWEPQRNLYLLGVRALPLWGVIYSRAIWWIISPAIEEITYQGYVLPRLEVLCGRSWVATLIVVFWWTLQHCALPLVPDWRYVAFRFVAFLPGVLVMTLIYLRLRRLPPLIVAHWPMDLGAVLMTLVVR
jgi:membrane protease YdiL (CAAX protease family)